MTSDTKISTHYTHGTLLSAIERSLTKLGKTRATVTAQDLAQVDEFHIGGRVASVHFLDQLTLSRDALILDIGCGLGGPARFVAGQYGSRVTGIDLTPEYIETGRELCRWLGLSNQVTLKCGNALEMDFADHSFDGAYLMHVGMNIENKPGLFSEVYRALKPGSYFGIYDIMKMSEGELAYPVPWASDESTSWLVSADQYIDTLQSTGFLIFNQENRGNFAREFFEKVQAENATRGKPPVLSLHTLIGEAAPIRLSNMVANIKAGMIAPYEIISKKPD